MGGSVVVNAIIEKGIKNVIGCIVLDIVEGTALEALIHMDSILASRPKYFTTQTHAVEWALSSRQIKNRSSANISIPSQIIEKDGVWRWRCDLDRSRPFWQGFKNNLIDHRVVSGAF
jgi:protein phosphatase methylesterase 1